jgi:CRP-like cAMP-binding protein
MEAPRPVPRPSEPVLYRLNALRKLSQAGAAEIEKAVRERVLRAAPSEDLISEGDRPTSVRIMLSGWACRYKTLQDGRRQIVNFLLPGDTCDAHLYFLSEMDHSIGALTPVTYADIERSRFEELIAGDRTVAEALWCETLVTNAIQREWAINLGRRDALERVAHLFCEVFERLRCVDLVDGTSCSFPVTQMDMADATGLSVVHLNRTLQELRGAGLITLKDRNLTIHDLDALREVALFNPNYLHLELVDKRAGRPLGM